MFIRCEDIYSVYALNYEHETLAYLYKSDVEHAIPRKYVMQVKLGEILT